MSWSPLAISMFETNLRTPPPLLNIVPEHTVSKDCTTPTNLQQHPFRMFFLGAMGRLGQACPSIKSSTSPAVITQNGSAEFPLMLDPSLKTYDRPALQDPQLAEGISDEPQQRIHSRLIATGAAEDTIKVLDDFMRSMQHAIDDLNDNAPNPVFDGLEKMARLMWRQAEIRAQKIKHVRLTTTTTTTGGPAVGKPSTEEDYAFIASMIARFLFDRISAIARDRDNARRIILGNEPSTRFDRCSLQGLMGALKHTAEWTEDAYGRVDDVDDWRQGRDNKLGPAPCCCRTRLWPFLMSLFTFPHATASQLFSTDTIVLLAQIWKVLGTAWDSLWTEQEEDSRNDGDQDDSDSDSDNDIYPLQTTTPGGPCQRRGHKVCVCMDGLRPMRDSLTPSYSEREAQAETSRNTIIAETPRRRAFTPRPSPLAGQLVLPKPKLTYNEWYRRYRAEEGSEAAAEAPPKFKVLRITFTETGGCATALVA
ncbi:hypothetical protein MN608_08644 [Microdochium nivale]|nr:hypothetical protein MN608_08644 [Microdochium nivale]